MPPLPVGNVGLYAQQTALHLAHGFVRGNRNHVDTHHHVPVQVGQFGNHAVLDIGGIVLQEDDAAELFAEPDIVGVLLDCVRADIILEVMAKPCFVGGIKYEGAFLSGAIEVMEHTQPFHGV